MKIKIKAADGTLINATQETKNGVMIVSHVSEETSVPYRWRFDDNARVKGYFIDHVCSRILSVGNMENYPNNYNIFATAKQAKSALAMARISQIMANDSRFGGVITDEEWMDKECVKYSIFRYRNEINFSRSTSYDFLAFHTKEQLNLFLEENEDLVKDYLMLSYNPNAVNEQKSVEWTEEDDKMLNWLIKEQEEGLEEVRNDRYGHQEIVSDLKESYHKKIDWLKSLKKEYEK